MVTHFTKNEKKRGMTSLPSYGQFLSPSKRINGMNLERLQNLKCTPNEPPKEPFIIGVCGGTASGKTTVCQQIVKSLKNKRVAVISQDSFYNPLREDQRQLALKSEYNFDHPGLLTI